MRPFHHVRQPQYGGHRCNQRQQLAGGKGERAMTRSKEQGWGQQTALTQDRDERVGKGCGICGCRFNRTDGGRHRQE